MAQITYCVTGSLFDADADALVNPVNCEGVAGRGLAKEFKERWPEIFKEYRRACKAKRMQIGTVMVLSTPTENGYRHIVHLPTKNEWRNPSKEEYIARGLKALVNWMQRNGVTSVALPALGCGAGGLPWPITQAAIEKAFANPEHAHIRVIVYLPGARRPPDEVREA